MVKAVSGSGERAVCSPSLRPNDGRVPREELAVQVDVAAKALLRGAEAHSLDVVGFRMGSHATARSHTWVHTPLHRWLLSDQRVITKVVALLNAP